MRAQDACETRDNWTTYWRRVPLDEINKLAERLGDRRAQVLGELPAGWQAAATTSAVRDDGDRVEQWARDLAKRFRYMMSPPPPPEEDIVRPLVKSAHLFRDLVPGAAAADLGGYGSWFLDDGMIGFRVDFSTGRMLAQKRGARTRRDAQGWATFVPLRLAPEVARDLDAAGNFPLATSLRLALPTEQPTGAVAGVEVIHGRLIDLHRRGLE